MKTPQQIAKILSQGGTVKTIELRGESTEQTVENYARVIACLDKIIDDCRRCMKQLKQLSK